MYINCSLPAGIYFAMSATRVKKFGTDEYDTDKGTGLPLYRVIVTVVPEDTSSSADSFTVKVASETDLTRVRALRIGGLKDFRAVLYGDGNTKASLRASGLLAYRPNGGK